MLTKMIITGGHHTSALPIISKLQSTYSEIKIFWFGHKKTLKGSSALTLEYKDITALNIPFFDLKAGKLYKTYDVMRLLKIPLGFFHALYLLLKIRPHVVLSFGGYLSAPTVLAAWLLGIPCYTHEQTLVAGYANRFVGHFCKKIFISWQDSDKYFPKEKIIFSGLPIRSEISQVLSSSFNINPSLPTIYITSGKTGSHTINNVVKSCLSELLSKYNIIHQCGDHPETNDYDVLSDAYKAIITPAGVYHLRKFVLSDEIGEAFSKADMLVSRSGAHTIAEILYLNKPALLIPIPWVSHNEQYKNAQKIVSNNLGMILEEKDLSSETLLDRIDKLNKNCPQEEVRRNSLDFSISPGEKRPEDIIISEIFKDVPTT